MIPHDSEKSDQGVHLVRVVNNRSGKTIDVLRKTPSLLKAAHNAPFGADGRFATVQDAAKAAILSPVEMRGSPSPYRLRYRLAWDHALCRAVLGVFARTLLAFYARTAQALGLPDGQTGTVTVIQRFGSGLQLNVHFHTLVLDGVFSAALPGPLTFHPAPPPSDADLAHVLATVCTRVGRLLARHQLEPQDDSAPADPLTETSPALAALVSASIQGRVALGPRAGARVCRLGDEPDLGHVTSRPARVRPSLTASTCIPTSGSPPTIAPAWSNSAAISSVPRSPKTASAPTGASSSNSRPRGVTARRTSSSSLSNSWRSSRPSSPAPP